MIVKTDFSNRLKELMFDNNLNTVQLAKATGISNSRICDWLNYNIFPYISSLVKLSDYFSCSIDFLAGRTEDPVIILSNKNLTFAERLKELTLKNKLSYYKVSKDLDFQRNLISKWLTGGGTVLYNLIKLADYFDCTIDYLLGRSDF